MREQHPLDDLFARALRDAEATPSDAVWEGISRERNWAHITLLHLRRRWGWVALVLLLAGAAAYQGVSQAPSGENRTERLLAIGDRLPQELTGAGPAFKPRVPEATEAGLQFPVASRPEQSRSTARPGTAILTSQAQGQHEDGKSIRFKEETQVAEEDAQVGYEQDLTRNAAASGTLKLNDNGAARNEKPEASVSWSPDPGRAGTGSGLLALGASNTVTPDVGFHEALSPSLSSMTLDGVYRLPVRWSTVSPAPAGATPRNLSGPSYPGPHVAWWLAATVGGYHEARTWHGPDEQLNQALQRTETPHDVTGIGALVGMERRGGWNLACGVEFISARYDFQHLDQFRSRQDSLVPFVITFNSQVVGSYTDTISTFTEVSNAVAIENHYSVVRIPVEGGWHRAWRRWHFGARAGLAVEFNTLRSGVTLVHENGGTRSVEISDAQKQTSLLLSGSLAADVGYAFSERWGLWASPTLSTCLFPLSPKGDTPYASTERFGVRLRLAYTLRQRP